MLNHQKRKVSSKIAGGLGNQLFKFLAGLKIAEEVGGDISFDISTYYKPKRINEKVSTHAFELDYFPNLSIHRFNRSQPAAYRFKLIQILKRMPAVIKAKFGLYDENFYTTFRTKNPPKFIEGNFEKLEFFKIGF